MTDAEFARINIIPRFWTRIEKTPSCWISSWDMDKDGYTVFSIRTRKVRAHRFSYELAKGKIPNNLPLDHLCRNRACVNPDHLEPVTNKENILRGEGLATKNKKKTCCTHGHEFTPENTYNQPQGGRSCRVCLRLNQIKYERKRKYELSHILTVVPTNVS